ncbi:MAG: sigma-54 dependent transcriptional regulator [Pirellulales bacterium]|nr:sigma-54 dependent transcriptional regulator [Pirellulales bacterium]
MSHVLIVDDEESISWALGRMARDEGHEVSVAPSAEEALALIERRRPDVVMLDVRLPGLDGLSALSRMQPLLAGAPVVVMTAFGSLDVAVGAFGRGAFEYLVKPFDLSQACLVLRRALSDAQQGSNKSEPLSNDLECSDFLGRSAAMQEVYKRIALAAPTGAPVLLTGESGTGKELAARAIHRHSLQADGPWVPVNVASLSPTLVESELFGHARGAFTGADAARQGLLELASGGTVFFDEVADIPLSVQVKLLRVLEQQEVTPVGETRPRKTSFRVVAATHRDLRAAVRDGTFREDLYYRLAVLPIELPPLRQRAEDIPLLAEHFLRLVRPVGAAPLRLSVATLEELSRRPWAGNVRELRNAVEAAALLARSGEILPEHLPTNIAPLASVPETPSLAAVVRAWANERLNQPTLPQSLYEDFLKGVEPALFAAVLERTSHNRAAAANVLGLHRATLRKKLNGD